MIIMCPVPQNGDVSSAADVHYIKLRILSCELFLVVMSGSLKDLQSSALEYIELMDPMVNGVHKFESFRA